MKKLISIILTFVIILSMITIVQAADFSGGGYNFVCDDGGRYLNVYAGKDADGTNVCVWERDGSPEQNYTISACGGGKYKLYPACSSSRVIDVNRGNSYDNPLKSGLNVDLWRTNDAPAQEFYITHVGNNLYKIELAALSGHVLQANNPHQNNGNVTLERYTGASNQHWKILKNGTQVTEPCTHKNIFNKNEKSTTEQKNNDMHTVIKTYDKVCNDCGKTIESNVKETKTEKHTIVKNKCKNCGYEAPVVEEKCNHSNTKENWQSSIVSQKDNTYHTVEEIYDVLCSDCGETIKKSQNKVYDEKHILKNDDCEKCSYVVSGSEAAKCKHTNTAKHSSEDMKTTISIKDDNQHTIASYYHVWCIDCFTYIKENELDLVHENHTFVNNICSVCNLEKFVEKTAYVYNTDGDNLNMRLQANSSSSIVVKIPAGASLTVTGDIINGFYPVKYNGKTGYSSADYITFTKPSVNKTAYVYNTDGANLNMRSNANKNSSIITKIPEGSTLTVTGDATNGFYPVKYGNYSGYASTAYITFTKPTNTSANQSLSNIRTTAPENNNKYYYSNSNIFYASGLAPYGSRIPSAKGNCTWYAWGRAYELTGTKPQSGLTGNAHTWWNGAAGKYSRGSTPKVGAIAVWKSNMPYSGGCGHVAIVEKIENGKVYISESGYPNTLFKYREIYNTNYLYGYIYIK